MARKHYSVEQIISLLRAGEVEIGEKMTIGEFCRNKQISEVTYYRWRKEYGGISMDQAKRMKDLEEENRRLRKAVSDLTLDKQILEEVVRGNF